MFSNIFLNKDNLIYNLNTLVNIVERPLCIMVKANAYGHGMKEIVTILQEYVDCFGVSNQEEAFEFRGVSNKKVIVFGRCEDYKKCIEKEISFSVFSLSHIKEIVKISKETTNQPKMELCINSGMNRYGIKDIKEFKKVISFLNKNNLKLQGLYTHFSSLTTDEQYTKTQYEKFKAFSSLIPKDWNTVRHIGGGQSILKDFDADMFRVGMLVYGYGNELVKPVLSLESKIVSLQQVEKGEHVGYLCSYTAEDKMKVAVIPLGYADGLPRKLSNKFCVKINGKAAKSVGNICMDSFMVDVSKIKCQVGDSVKIFNNAREIAKRLDTTEYEVLTNLSKLRGNRNIV